MSKFNISFYCEDFTSVPVTQGSKVRLTPISSSGVPKDGNFIVVSNRVVQKTTDATGLVVFTNTIPQYYLCEIIPAGGWHVTQFFISASGIGTDLNAKDLIIDTFVSGSISGSVSYAVLAGFANTASHAIFAENATSASYAPITGVATTALTASIAYTASHATFAENATSASFATSASYEITTEVSSSHADVADAIYTEEAAIDGITYPAIFTANGPSNQPLYNTSNVTINPAQGKITATRVTASLYGTSSAANIAYAINFVPQTANSASWVSASAKITTADTASFVTASNVVGTVTSASYATPPYPVYHFTKSLTQLDHTITRKWQGQYNPIQAQYYTMLDLGFKCNVTNIGGPAWELVATGVLEIDLRYEILFEKGQKGLLDSRLDIVKTCTAYNKKILNLTFNEPNKFLNTVPPFTGSVTEVNQALQVYSLMTSGVKSVVEFFPTLKMSYMCNNTYQVFNNMANNGKILKTSTLINQTGAPANSIVPLLPQDGPYSAFVGNYPGSLVVPLYYGWMQLGPTVEQTQIARITVAQEWNYGLWPPWMYGYPI